MKILQFQERAHEIAVSKGFWEVSENLNRSEMVTLIISELTEAVEAHRTDKVFPKTSNLNTVMDILDKKVIPNDPSEWNKILNDMFETAVKDTISDEVADTAIRLIGYCYGWKIELSEVYPFVTHVFSGNFGADVLYLIKKIMDAHAHEMSGSISRAGTRLLWSDALASLKDFSAVYNIDLEWHIEQKLRYNSTRPYKHAKAY